MPRIVIFANGKLDHPQQVHALIRPDDEILCADGGTRHALALGLSPAMVIGDLDSIAEPERMRLEAAGVRFRKHPRDKDETDLELALRYALERGPSTILIIGALGERLDHTLGNIALLADPSLAGSDARLDDGLEEVLLCRLQVEIQGKPGELVSLIPWGGAARGIRTTGLKWPLRDESLYPEKTRGISNEMLEHVARIRLSSGLLLIIHRRQTQAENRK
ncbi:MAG TPA: thiamine diphosphokinase [Anaerolineales bacterium]